MSRVEIYLERNGRREILVDGVKVPNVTRLEFSASHGAQFLTIEVLATDVVIVADAEVETKQRVPA